jgi:hypothetical protein
VQARETVLNKPSTESLGQEQRQNAADLVEIVKRRTGRELPSLKQSPALRVRGCTCNAGSPMKLCSECRTILSARVQHSISSIEGKISCSNEDSAATAVGRPREQLQPEIAIAAKHGCPMP